MSSTTPSVTASATASAVAAGQAITTGAKAVTEGTVAATQAITTGALAVTTTVTEGTVAAGQAVLGGLGFKKAPMNNVEINSVIDSIRAGNLKPTQSRSVVGSKQDLSTNRTMDTIPEEEPTEEEEQKAFPTTALLWMAAALGSAVMSIVAIVLSAAAAPVIVAAIVAIAIAGGVAVVETKIHGLESFRHVHNKIRNQVGKLTAENDKLHGSVSELEVSVDRLRESEDRLQYLVDKQGMSVDVFVNLVKVNQETLTKMRTALKRQLSQDMLGKILNSDLDGDNHIDDREIDILIGHMQALEGSENVDERKFRMQINQTRGSVFSVLGVVKEFLDPDAVEEGDE